MERPEIIEELGAHRAGGLASHSGIPFDLIRHRRTIAPVRLTVVLMLICLGSGKLLARVRQNPGNWGLWRIDQPDLTQARTANQLRYVADGTGVNIYVIDNGVLSSHPDFCCDSQGHSRASWVGAFCWGAAPRTVDPSTSLPYPETIADDGYDGHGTHNASFAAGDLSGAARNAHVYALRVTGPEASDCTSEQAVINAVTWITHHGQLPPYGPRPSVVNISFCCYSSAVWTAIHDSIAAGFVYTLSADTGGDVETHWGTRLPREALVVGGTDDHDNPIAPITTTPYGPQLALFAPAKGLCGASLGEGMSSPCGARYSIPEIAVCPRPCRNPVPGDSFAAPFVAGVAAVYLQQHPSARPVQVRQAIIGGTARGKVTNVGAPPHDSPNRLLQMVGDGPSR
jgi:subtilisin family serine protease